MIRATRWNGCEYRLSRVRFDRRMFLAAAWLILQGLDVATTAYGLRTGLTEANGIAALAFAKQGELAVYGFKGFVALFILGLILLLQPRYPRLWLGLQIVTGYMVLAVSFNILNIALGA